jgi:hypothetical protein
MFYRHQAWGFFPLLLLEALNLRVASVRYLITDRTRSRTREALLMGLHLLGYLALIFLVLSPVRALAFIAVYQGLFGLYLGLSFAPNHKGMPQLNAADNADYLRRQVLTSRNGPRPLAHQLRPGRSELPGRAPPVPSMRRTNLRHAQHIAKTFCQAHRVPYQETGLIASYAQALRYLDTVGKSPATT